jgi:hypothetical protein
MTRDELADLGSDAEPHWLDRMEPPMRRPPSALPIGSMVLAFAFVLGFVCGAVSVLWLVA